MSTPRAGRSPGGGHSSGGGRSPGGRPAPFARRPLGEADLAACADVFYAALDELYGRQGVPRIPRDPPAMAALFRYVALEPGGRGRVALDRDGRVIGFGIAFEREASWYLAFLFVLPERQGRGVGRGLLEELLPAPGSPAAADGALRAVCADSLQPVAIGLYARHGLLPQVPILTLVGRPGAGSLAGLPDGVSATPFAAAPLTTRPLALPAVAAETLPPDLLAELDALDMRTVGYRRRGDHRRWLGDGRLLVRYRGGDGTPLAYGYLHQSGRTGPVACRDEALLEPILGDLVTRVPVAGALRVYVPGPAAGALVPLLRAGFRLDGSPAIWAANRAGPAWERYLPASFALP